MFSLWASSRRGIVTQGVSSRNFCLPLSHLAQTSALDILMSLLKHLSTSLSKSSQRPQFHVPHFKKVIDALLTCPPSERGGKKRSTQGELDAEVRDQFVVKWLNVYTDVRWFFLRDAEYDLSSLPSVLCPQLTNFLFVQTSAFIFFTQDQCPCPREPSFLPREAGVISSCIDRTEVFLGGRVASQASQVEEEDTDGL